MLGLGFGLIWGLVGNRNLRFMLQVLVCQPEHGTLCLPKIVKDLELNSSGFRCFLRVGNDIGCVKLVPEILNPKPSTLNAKPCSFLFELSRRLGARPPVWASQSQGLGLKQGSGSRVYGLGFRV